MYIGFKLLKSLLIEYFHGNFLRIQFPMAESISATSAETG